MGGGIITITLIDKNRELDILNIELVYKNIH